MTYEMMKLRTLVDAHEGIKAAAAKVLIASSRCRVHFMRK
jgi:hypothetical protein